MRVRAIGFGQLVASYFTSRAQGWPHCANVIHKPVASSTRNLRPQRYPLETSEVAAVRLTRLSRSQQMRGDSIVSKNAESLVGIAPHSPRRARIHPKRESVERHLHQYDEHK